MKNFIKVSSVLVVIVGIVLVAGGIFGLWFTYTSVAAEKIVSPNDAVIAGQPVLGPLTLKAQADVIRKHVLGMTGGKTYAEMPRQIPKLGANNQPVIGEDGKPVMTANAARDIWITATTLITALNLALLAYALSGLSLVIGLALIWAGLVVRTLLSMRSII